MEQKVLDPETIKRNRWMAIGIMLLPIFVLSAATLLWIAVKSGNVDIVGNLGTHNKGTLLSPAVAIESIPLLDSEGQLLDYTQQPAKWSLLIPGAAACDEECRQELWLTRQLHQALGRRASHLRRYYVSDSWPLEPEFADYLAAEHPSLQILRAEPAALTPLAAGDRTPLAGEYYLVDKRGFIMMAYGAGHSGREVIADLKFLMKQVGDE